jgi:hypothetical protein
MRKLILIASVAAAMAACGQPATTSSEAQAQTNAAGAQASGDVTAAERAAILGALSAHANAAGQLENECGEWVTPQFLPADLGAGVGRAVAFVMEGGPNTAACYGDGPLVQLMRYDGGAWREIYQNRGGGLIILPTLHNNANDMADGGPGFSFPVWEWNGTEYVNANRQVADSALSDARFLPN